jgi:aspartate/methionine/tyrosine aminotransferase
LELESQRRSGRNLIDLTVSNPTEAGFHYEENCIREALASSEVMTYAPEARGLLTAREAISSYYAECMPPCVLDPEDIFVLSGTSEAYAHIFRLLCDAGDEVLIGSPGYPLLDLLADICDVMLVRFHFFYDHGWHIDIHDLEQKLSPRARAIVLVNPNNPTGSYIKGSEREQLIHLCRNRNIALIVDEVFLDYEIESDRPKSFAGQNDVLTFTLSGLSKVAGLPQMKAAWAVASGPEKRKREAIRRLELISDTFLSTGTPVQVALDTLLDVRHAFQQQLKSRLRMNLAQLDEQLRGKASCARLLVEGGWYVTVRVPTMQSDEELAISLLKQEGVIVESGHFFDFPNDGYLVLSLMTPELEFSQGVGRILARF